MIPIHRISHPDDDLLLNPDLVLTVEANPDTVVTLVTGARFVVTESPVEVAELIRRWRSSILRDAPAATTSGAAQTNAAAAVVRLLDRR